jgi:hypothetical protein
MQSHSSLMGLNMTEKADCQIIEFVQNNITSRKAEMKNMSLFTRNEPRFLSLAQTYKHLMFPL